MASISIQQRNPRLLATALAAVALALAGCGGGGGGSSGAPASGPVDTSGLTADTQGIPAFAPGTVPGSIPHTASVSSSPGTAPAPGTALSAASCEAAFQYVLTANPVLTGTEPLLSAQWHLENTGLNTSETGAVAGEDTRAKAAWLLAGGRGLGARVSVIDDAVEVVHDDLAPNLVTGASFNYRFRSIGGLASYPLPCASGQDHGTAVAGVAAARDGNSIGGSGVAPRASLAAFNALATNLDSDISDALLRDQAVNGVYNNSWGSFDNGKLHTIDATIKTAINDGLANGRGGKGSVYVFPGGNGGCISGQQPDASYQCPGDQDNANFDGYVNRYGVIAVCATNDRGTKSWYSEPGANLLLCAPSSNLTENIRTTDVRNSYRSDFSGTSAAVPMVSGVAALVLSVRPDLSYRDVMLILAGSARQNDPADRSWVAGNGHQFSHKYGFGVVNAAAAVTLASSWTSVGGFAQVRNCGWYRNPVNAALPDGDRNTGRLTPVANTIAVPADCPIRKIEFVEIALNAPHTYTGDLRVRLTSPNGLVSELANERVCVTMDPNTGLPVLTNGRTTTTTCGDYDSNWVFGSVRHLDESSVGGWTLQLTDMLSGDTGTWNSWSLRLWGRP